MFAQGLVIRFCGEGMYATPRHLFITPSACVAYRCRHGFSPNQGCPPTSRAHTHDLGGHPRNANRRLASRPITNYYLPITLLLPRGHPADPNLPTLMLATRGNPPPPTPFFACLPPPSPPFTNSPTTPETVARSPQIGYRFSLRSGLGTPKQPLLWSVYEFCHRSRSCT